MGSDRRRLNLSLSMQSPQQREAWKVLRAIPPGQRTDAVCRMVCRAQEQDRLLDAIRKMFREELGRLELYPTREKQKNRRPGMWTRASSAFCVRCRREMIQPDTLF